MTYQLLHHSIARLVVVIVAVAAAGCTVANPSHQAPDANPGVDGSADSPNISPPLCTANQPLRCEKDTLVRCDMEGKAEITETCHLGCNNAELRCTSFTPSNGLVAFLDQANAQLDIDLGESATIDTDTGNVSGLVTPVKSDTLMQSSGPPIRVLVVRSFTAKNVTVKGKNALAIVSQGDIAITGVFAASGEYNVAGPGGYNDASCQGKDSTGLGGSGFATGGPGGGGFGSDGGSGGSAQAGRYSGAAGTHGIAAGNESLSPLRGGCDSGRSPGGTARTNGGGGGALQFVSGTRIAISSSGVVAANGASAEAGGSGGGILFEAPICEVSGHVVANGAGASASTIGQDGRLDDQPAIGGTGIPGIRGAGGNGAAGTTQATEGGSVSSGSDTSNVRAGGGGGGFGRIRVNSAPGGLLGTGLFSPNPSRGSVVAR